MSKARPLVTLLALALAGCSGTAHGPQARTEPESAKRTAGRIEFEPCALSGKLAAQTLDGMCGKLAVPLDPAKPTGAKIDLRVVWLRPADRVDPAADPVFFLAGGPGQAASDYASTVYGALHEVLKSRSVFLVDQRGTGKSAPLDCPPALRDEYKDRDDVASIAEYAGKCAVTQKNDPRLFTTTVAVEDLDTVRKALGAEKVDLVGVSYGTRVAQQYAMRHPAQTRAVVLDGVLPNDVVAGGEFARTFERSLQMRDKACATDPVCRKRYPQDLRTQLATLKRRLAAAPVDVEYRDPATGESKHDKLTAQTVVGLTQLFSYVPEAAALLPVVVDEAIHERYGPLTSLASLGGESVAGSMNRGMQWSVICAEDVDRYVPDPADANTALGSDMADLFFAACKAWPKGTRPPDFSSPLASKVPVLLMSGELDPVTPPYYAERVARTLPNSKAVVLRGQGHNVMGTGCMPKLIGKFIETANAKALDTKCLETVAPVPPFTSFNGWEP
ncbi:alpha/beta hydrolase [Cognatilysobacter lacus]|uniref:Alpha/beta hydrolase n=1 Tax=Cognatilysobacter lacus TaxID=1643323 RepID=A0A5D8Z5R2_9GAMM|nr:alpha/beta hydrolase [Lysobacter lacus]TZF90089.1 alpha/beta hydrolase [Lysobacter lacus]